MKPIKNKLFLGGISLLALVISFLFLSSPDLWAQEKVEKTLDPKYSQVFHQVLRLIMDRYVDEVDPQVLFDGAMKGMLESLGDPYTVYLDASDMIGMQDTTTGEFGGVGMFINKVPPSSLRSDSPFKDQFVEIVSPIEDTPAFRAGIQPGDYVMAVNSETTAGMTMDRVLGLLRGKPGTEVMLKILRGGEIQLDVKLIRALIEVPTVKYAMVEPSWGYLRIIQFTTHTTERVQEALESFSSKDYKGLIIDLRSNPGGTLDSVVRIGDFFFRDGQIVSTRSRLPGESTVFTASAKTLVPDTLPIVVLIDKGSASASEILAGALKDRSRAILIGEKTYGKGSVQQIYPYENTGFKITMARYYTPSGVNIDKIGIEPDLKIENPPLTDVEIESYRKLIKENTIETFAKENPQSGPGQIRTFVSKIRSQGVNLDERVLGRMISSELNRINNRTPPVYSLEYDEVLQAGIKVLTEGGLPKS